MFLLGVVLGPLLLLLIFAGAHFHYCVFLLGLFLLRFIFVRVLFNQGSFSLWFILVRAQFCHGLFSLGLIFIRSRFGPEFTLIRFLFPRACLHHSSFSLGGMVPHFWAGGTGLLFVIVIGMFCPAFLLN